MKRQRDDLAADLALRKAMKGHLTPAQAGRTYRYIEHTEGRAAADDFDARLAQIQDGRR